MHALALPVAGRADDAEAGTRASAAQLGALRHVRGQPEREHVHGARGHTVGGEARAEVVARHEQFAEVDEVAERAPGAGEEAELARLRTRALDILAPRAQPVVLRPRIAHETQRRDAGGARGDERRERDETEVEEEQEIGLGLPQGAAGRGEVRAGEEVERGALGIRAVEGALEEVAAVEVGREPRQDAGSMREPLAAAREHAHVVATLPKPLNGMLGQELVPAGDVGRVAQRDGQDPHGPTFPTRRGTRRSRGRRGARAARR